MRVTVYGELRAATGTKTVDVDADVETVADALDAFLDRYPTAHSRLLDDEGAVRPSVRIMLGGERIDLAADCPADAHLKLFPAMRGGGKTGGEGG